jgi:hypothetical protein
MTPVIDMTTDLEHIHKSLQAIIKTQIDFPTGETQMFFDNIHLSPLKVFISRLNKIFQLDFSIL